MLARIRRIADGMFIDKGGYSDTGKFYGTAGFARGAATQLGLKPDTHEIIEYEVVEKIVTLYKGKVK